VHRHFGSKDALLGAVLDSLAGDVAAALDGADPATLLAPGGPLDAYWHVLARTILDGGDLPSLQHEFPTVRRLLVDAAGGSTATGDHGAVGLPARLAVAHAVACGLGWMLFEPFLVAAAGLDDLSDRDLRAEAGRAAASLLVGARPVEHAGAPSAPSG